LDDLRRGVAFIREEIARGGGVYIHCGAGVGRAPALAAAYLVSTGLSPQEAWARIRAVRPFIRPKPAQIEQIEQFAASNP
jgi:protein-tyrosine phosphatase